MDKHLLEDKAKGLTASISELRAHISKFDEAKGLDKSILKAQEEIQALEVDIQVLKENGAELKEKYRGIAASITQPIMDAMDAILPSGISGISIDGKNLEIAWVKDNVARPYNALSGGEKAAFDAALASALGATVIIVEAAEIDGPNLHDELEKLAQLPQQVIVNTCHHLNGTFPEGFSVVNLG
jgi:hypothetical protein